MSLKTFQALVFILRAIIETFQYLTGAIEDHKYHKSMADMKESIKKATNGPLETRLEGGQEVEDRINRRVGP
jgi:hypothetical protein